MSAGAAAILDKWVKLRGSGELTDQERKRLHAEVIRSGEPAPELFRGVSIDASGMDFSPGRAIDFEPSSTSEDPGSAWPYAENGDRDPVVFEFAPGARALNVQDRAEAVEGYAEAEWVTAGRFYVTGTRDEDGVKVVSVSGTPPTDPAAQKRATQPAIDMGSVWRKNDPVPEAGAQDLAGPGGQPDPSPDLPGPVVGQGPAGGGSGLPGHVAPFVTPGSKVYVHPQGSYVVVGLDGSVTKIGPDGKPRKTSAAAAKLAVGHGKWTPIEASVPAPVKKETGPPLAKAPLADLKPEKAVVVASKDEEELPSLPAPKTSTFRVPMAFNEAPVVDVPKYIEDPNFHFQQKVDGIRGQLVIEPGKQPWFRSKSGQKLVNSSAAKITGPLLDKLGKQSDYDGPTYTIDGELLDGKWYVFDVAVEGSEKTPWEDRMSTAEAWVAEMHKLGLLNIQALPVARTAEEKRALWEAVQASGGEGVMMKRKDAPYGYGQRVNHTLKAKITSTADVVVMARNLGGKENAEIGIHVGGKLVSIGTVSMQGKEKGGAVNVGDVIEVEYLWANPANNNLQQPRMKKKRPDKSPADANSDQLRFVGKQVVDVVASGS